MIKLWRMAHVRAFVAAIMITQFHSIHTKVAYFGRQMLGMDHVKARKEQMLNRDGNPTWVKLIYPNSHMKKLWDYGMLFLVLYTAAYAPFRTAFMSYDSSVILIVFETFTDLLLLLDIFMSFMTPYERQDGTHECNIKKISRHYILKYLFFDMVAILPTQFFDPAIDVSWTDYAIKESKKTTAVLRILRILKVFKINKY